MHEQASQRIDTNPLISYLALPIAKLWSEALSLSMIV